MYRDALFLLSFQPLLAVICSSFLLIASVRSICLASTHLQISTEFFLLHVMTNGVSITQTMKDDEGWMLFGIQKHDIFHPSIARSIIVVEKLNRPQNPAANVEMFGAQE